jgi:RsiW-degrading membrane proteinase PrsW (M82 family)
MKNASKSIPITVQLQIATRKGNRLATAIGAVLGTVVPVMVYAVTHKLPMLPMNELPFWVLAVMALGGCFFSMKSVIVWGRMAFQQDTVKAVAFALLLEGMLVMSGLLEDMYWLGYASLAYLCLINAVSAGCSIALEARAFGGSSNLLPRKRNRK